ncbi:MAG TPA: hypothetical protein VGM14_16530 [Streptosporangiaceae bacterium]
MLAQLAFAQFTLLLTICYLLIDRLSRWRPPWLVLPTAIGVAWLLAWGPGRSVAGYLAGGSHLVGNLVEPGPLLTKLGNLRGALTGWRQWLPRQLPVALIVAAAEAAMLVLPGRATRSARYRRGVLVLARCGYLSVVLRRGEVATADGCCLGIAPTTGARAEITWREAEAGVLCLSQDPAAVSATGRDLALAAIQHRKAVIVIDLNGRPAASQPGRAGRACQASLANQLGLACAEVTAPLRWFGWQPASFDPIADASPDKATSLVLAMIDWTGAGQARRLLCASYLEVALAALKVAGAQQGASASRPVPLLDELIGLLAPGALPARVAELRGHPAVRGELATKVAELTGQLGGDHSVLAPVIGQLAELARELTPKPSARSTRSPADQQSITMTATLARREVAYFPLDRPVRGRSAEMIARLVVASLTDALTEHSDLGIGCDCLVWIDGCETLDARQLGALISLGTRTGTAVALGTTVAATATALAAQVNVIALRGSGPPGLRNQGLGNQGLGNQVPDDRLPRSGRPDRLSWTVLGPPTRLVTGTKVVR